MVQTDVVLTLSLQRASGERVNRKLRSSGPSTGPVKGAVRKVVAWCLEIFLSMPHICFVGFVWTTSRFGLFSRSPLRYFPISAVLQVYLVLYALEILLEAFFLCRFGSLPFAFSHLQPAKCETAANLSNLTWAGTFCSWRVVRHHRDCTAMVSKPTRVTQHAWPFIILNESTF